MENQFLKKMWVVAAKVMVVITIILLSWYNKMCNITIDRQAAFIDTLMVDNQKRYGEYYVCRLQLFKCRIDSFWLERKIDSLENNKK